MDLRSSYEGVQVRTQWFQESAQRPAWKVTGLYLKEMWLLVCWRDRLPGIFPPGFLHSDPTLLLQGGEHTIHLEPRACPTHSAHHRHAPFPPLHPHDGEHHRCAPPQHSLFPCVPKSGASPVPALPPTPPPHYGEHRRHAPPQHSLLPASLNRGQAPSQQSRTAALTLLKNSLHKEPS